MNIERSDILDTRITKTGCFETRIFYLRGKYPEGREINGYTGIETVHEERIVKPIIVVNVVEDPEKSKKVNS